MSGLSYLTNADLALIHDALSQAADALDNYADADCVGDPPHYVPNRAMSAAAAVERALELMPVTHTCEGTPDLVRCNGCRRILCLPAVRL